MVFFNYATMQMAAKIVYYGAGLCGKTTNLHYIYAKTSPQSRGEMVSLETETDRTLFFDLLPIDVGVIGGFKTRLQLYTIPGQVFYNTTRKLVLKGVDGLVFVADSQQAMQDANVESLHNLRENLNELGVKIEDIPLIVQLNKRDLPNVTPIEAILDRLDPDHKYEHIDSIAATGVGVFETLKLISKLTLRTLRRRMTGEEVVKPAPRVAAQVATFRVKEPPAYESRSILNTPAPAGGSVAIQAEEVEETETSEQIAEAAPAQQTFSDSTLAKVANLDAHIISDVPIPTPAAPPAPEPEPDVNFSQTAKPAKKTEVKHVKVRSSVDIMAELEALRKKATQTPPKQAKKEVSPLDALLKTRDVQKSINLKVPSNTLSKSKSLRVAVSFENSDGVVQQQEQTIELGDVSDAQSLSVNLKINS
jgi:signal recognition particle receptor subunit beta